MRGAGEERKLKQYIRPMLARLHDEPFDDPGWIFEIKWDGYRAIAETGKKTPRLYSRNGLSFEEYYPDIFEAIRGISAKAVIDGEIVALNEAGLPSFQLLQNEGTQSASLCYYVFDILSLNGRSVESLPLTERKQLLKELLPEHPQIRYCDHVAERGKEFFTALSKSGMEGMIAKRADSVYVEASRTPDWLKIKHILTDEAVIAGYTEPRGSRKNFGALVLGTYRNGKLEYIGHTGTGFTARSLHELHERLQRLVTDGNPFGTKIPVNAPVTWVRPELVCNIKYTERTSVGYLRHPVFMGLREDKAAEEVTGADAAVPENQSIMKDSINVGGHRLSFTHTDKIFWPEEGFTKGDVIAYYDAASKYILKYLKNRPLSLKRNPNGIADHGFFHKDAGQEAPDWVDRQKIWSPSSEKDIHYILCNKKATLLYLANLGCIEINPWHSTTAHLEQPDYLIMDIDPSEKNTFDQVIETAKAIREVLDRAGAAAFIKTSGSTGLHIYVPLKARYTYEQANTFAEIIATQAQELVPDFTSLERSLKKRGKDQIYIDYMQNNIGQTVAAPYSLRPKPHAPVSAPIEWEELKKGLSIEQFNITNIFKRLEKKGDLFAGLLTKSTDIIKCLKRLGA